MESVKKLNFYFNFSIKIYLTALKMSICNDFENVMPYNKVVDGNWKMLEPSQVAKLVHYKFGILSWNEINSMKEKMDEAKNKLDAYKKETKNEMYNLEFSIGEEKRKCSSNEECSVRLDAHISTCDSKYKCTKNFVAYECQFKRNGRCSHYYEIEHLEKDLDDCQYDIDNYSSRYYNLKSEYERALAIKENSLAEHEQDEEDEYDDWNFEVGQRMW
jgi:hypothetical protein